MLVHMCERVGSKTKTKLRHFKHKQGIAVKGEICQRLRNCLPIIILYIMNRRKPTMGRVF